MTPPAVELAVSVTHRGGVWRHVLDLATALMERDHEVVMTLPSSAADLNDEARRIGCRPPGPRPAPVFHLHLADTYDSSARPLLRTARRRGQATVLTEHLPRTDASDSRVASRRPRPGATTLKTIRKRRQLAYVDAIVAVSRSSADFLCERYRLTRRQVHVVPNGVRASSGPWVDRSTSRDRVHYVAVGSVIEQKGFDRLVAAAAHARRPWHVDVLGQGPHLPALREQASAFVLEDGTPRLSFLGWRDDPDDVLARADALVLPSRWESAPYVVLEAMNAGLAVLATRVDGPSEQVVDGVTGSLVAGDGASIASTLDWGVDHRSELDAWGRAGRERVARSFGLDASVEGTLGVYLAATTGRDAR